nr:hypothetical protein [Tanacetum cinerariifolium]
MPIPSSLITIDIQGASYYQEYLEKVAKHQRYMAGETGSDPNSPTPKPTKTAKKSMSIAPKADPRPQVSKLASTKQPEPKLAPAKTQGKKRKLTIKISDKPSKARKTRPGLVSKTRKPISSLRSVDKSVAEDIPEKEPRVDDEEADVQRALKESLKSMYDVPRGPLPPVVIREPERTFAPTGSSGYDESSSLYAELGLTDNEEESDEDVPGTDAGVQGEGHAGPNSDAQDEGQAGSNPDEQAEGQAGPDLGNAEASQPLPSLVVHAGSDLEHIDLDVTDVPAQPHPEQMDERLIETAYPKVQENLKLTVEEHVILEELASSSGTLSSLQHLTKDLNFGDLFFSDKPSEADNDKATAEIDAESMVTVMIQQDTSSIPPMTKLIIDLTPRPKSPKHIGELEHIMANLIQDNKQFEQRLDSHGARLLEHLDIPHQVSKAANEVVTNTVDWAMQAPLQNRFRDLPKADMKEILHQRIWETDSYKTHEDHMQLYDALEKSMNHDHSEELEKDLAEARKKKKKSHDSPKTPPGSPPHQPPHPPPPAGSSKASRSSGASGSSQVPPPPPPPLSTNKKEERPATPEPAWSIPTSDVPIPMNNWASTLMSTYSPPPEDSLLVQTGDMAMFMDWFCKRRGITELKPQDLEGPVFEIIKVFHPNMWIEEEYKYDIAAMYGFEFKHDYTVIDSPKAVTFQDRYRVQMIMRFNEIHKFSDGTLHQINEALDYRIRKFKINKMNPGLNTRFWTRKDVDRSKEFMFAIRKRLKTRRIFRNLECFVGGRVKYGDYKLLKHTE